jgi:hypothetical protein
MALDVEDLLKTLYDYVSNAKIWPLGRDLTILDRDKILGILDEIRVNMPPYLENAKRIAQDEKRILDNAQRSADLKLQKAESQAKQMVDSSTIVTTATQKAKDIEHTSNQKSAQLRKTSNEYVDNLLKRTEEAVTAALREVQQSRSDFRTAANQQEKR